MSRMPFGRRANIGNIEFPGDVKQRMRKVNAAPYDCPGNDGQDEAFQRAQVEAAIRVGGWRDRRCGGQWFEFGFKFQFQAADSKGQQSLYGNEFFAFQVLLQAMMVQGDGEKGRMSG